jgi:hypothetical protein
MLIALKKRLRPRSRVASDSVQIVDPDRPVDPAEQIIGLGRTDVAATRTMEWIVTHSARQRIIDLRRHNYQRLAEALRGVAGARVLRPELPAGVAPYVFPLWVDRGDACYFAFKGVGLPVFRWDQVWPETPAFGGIVGGPWARHLLQLPCHQSLTTTDMDWIAETARRVLEVRGLAAGKRAVVAGFARAEQ